MLEPVLVCLVILLVAHPAWPLVDSALLVSNGGAQPSLSNGFYLMHGPARRRQCVYTVLPCVYVHEICRSRQCNLYLLLTSNGGRLSCMCHSVVISDDYIQWHSTHAAGLTEPM